MTSSLALPTSIASLLKNIPSYRCLTRPGSGFIKHIQAYLGRLISQSIDWGHLMAEDVRKSGGKEE
jgi:hypothetical protein